jgi:hypothetical protein
MLFRVFCCCCFLLWVFILLFIHFCIFITSPGGQDTIEAVRAAQLAKRPVVVISISLIVQHETSHSASRADYRPNWWCCISHRARMEFPPFVIVRSKLKAICRTKQSFRCRNNSMEYSMEDIERFASEHLHLKADESPVVCLSLMRCVESRDQVSFNLYVCCCFVYSFILLLFGLLSCTVVKTSITVIGMLDMNHKT